MTRLGLGGAGRGLRRLLAACTVDSVRVHPDERTTTRTPAAGRYRPAMKSIRTYDGEIRVCNSCGQPCYLGDTEFGLMWLHFQEQWDGVYCPRHPLAEQQPVSIDWDETSLRDLKERYPDTYPYPSRV